MSTHSHVSCEVLMLNLIFSALGMGSFGVAHLFYSLCFLTERYACFSSRSSSLLYVFYLLLWLVGGGVYAYLLPYLQKVPDAAVLTPAVGAYVLLIVVMVTLALRTRRPLTLLGSLIFMVSDLCLSLQHFEVVPRHEYGQHVVMVTYYLAQLLIAMGDVRAKVDENDEFRKWKRS